MIFFTTVLLVVLVPSARVERACLAATASETVASAISATRGANALGVDRPDSSRVALGLRPALTARPALRAERTGDARVTTLSLRPLGDGQPQTHMIFKLAPPAGFDPAASGSTDRRSSN